MGRSMTRMRILNRILVTVAAAAAVTSCGDVVRSSRAPVFLVIDSLSGARGNTPTRFTNNLFSDVITLVTTPAPCTPETPCPTIFNDVGQAVLRLSPKDIGSGATTAPTLNNEVTITRIHVRYRRTDGRNTPGVDVPFEFDTAATVTVPASGTATMGFTLVRNSAKSESPLVQLSATGFVIATLADITLYGRDQVGNDISATGSMEIAFANFGDTQ